MISCGSSNNTEIFKPTRVTLSDRSNEIGLIFSQEFGSDFPLTFTLQGICA